MNDEIHDRIWAMIEHDLNDPEWRATAEAARDEMRRGEFMSWRIAVLPAPDWIRRLLSHFIDRRFRRAIKKLVP